MWFSDTKKDDYAAWVTVNILTFQVLVSLQNRVSVNLMNIWRNHWNLSFLCLILWNDIKDASIKLHYFLIKEKDVPLSERVSLRISLILYFCWPSVINFYMFFALYSRFNGHFILISSFFLLIPRWLFFSLRLRHNLLWDDCWLCLFEKHLSYLI